MSGTPSFLSSVMEQFDRAAGYSNLPPGLINQVRSCNSVYHLRFPVELEDGRIELGFLSTDGERITPAIRFLPADMPSGVWMRSGEIVEDTLNLNPIRPEDLEW